MRIFTFHYVSISTLASFLPLLYWYTFTFHYVSISTNTDTSDYYTELIYIPLCIYFNPSKNWTLEDFTAIYIPLCIYFNGKRFAKKYHWVYLHSTMYLFQRAISSTPTIYNKPFTFHYVSISTLANSIFGTTADFIYIPLCIYFNIDKGSYYSIYKSIYIPLCIYFNPVCLCGLMNLKKIYIPLCIYFNSLSLNDNCNSSLIYIPLCIYFNRSVTTFVYGCSHIYIPLCIYFNS